VLIQNVFRAKTIFIF